MLALPFARARIGVRLFIAWLGDYRVRLLKSGIMTLTLSELSQSLDRFSKISHTLEKPETRLASNIGVATTRFFKDEAVGFFLKHIDEAILRSDSCDATPLTTLKVNRFDFFGWRVVR